MTEPSATDSLPLLATKLYRPPVTADVMPRPHLLERLDCNIYRPLTLISAPVGYGKTTLASMWLQDCGCPSAWVSLDESDNDLRAFVQYVAAAIQGVFPAARLGTRSLLEVPNLPPVAVLARHLLNDLNQIAEPFVLALDDLHFIREPAIYDLLGELLDHPARSMRLLLIGRRDPPLPIASLRAHGMVTEIRARDLRFDVEETAQLLTRILGRDVNPTTAADWNQRTEGWVTALLLAALSLRQRGQEDDLNADPRVNSRYLHDYLVAEVLGQLPEARRSCLLKIAILDRFCPTLCEALCRQDPNNDDTRLDGEEFIGWLRRENLFLISLDDRGTWFRLHPLFQGLLQQTLKSQAQPGEIAELHRRASAWFAENGPVDEAIEQAVAAGDTSVATRLVMQHRYELMNTAQWHRLDRLIKLLPADAVAHSPLLLSARVHIATHRDDEMIEVLSSLRPAEQLLASLTPGTVEYETAQGEIGVIYALWDLLGGSPTRAIDRASSSLRLLPREALHARAAALGELAVAYQMRGDLTRGAELIRVQLANHAWPEVLQTRMMQYLCTAYFHEGDLPSIVATTRRCVENTGKPLPSETLSYCRYHLGIAHYLRNELTEAEPVLRALLEDRAISGPLYLAQGGFGLALLLAAQDRTTDAAQVINALEDHFREVANSLGLAYTKAFRVELALRQGNTEKARLRSETAKLDVDEPKWWFYSPALTAIKLMLAERTGRSLFEARGQLDTLDEQMRQIRRNNLRIDILALLALVCDALGDVSVSHAKLTEALLLAERGGSIRNFVDLGPPMAELLTRLQLSHGKTQDVSPLYVAQILAAFASDGRQAKAPHAPIFAPASALLTERELEVLKLLATELSPREIAQVLSIATATVRAHTKSIYGKLDVHSRSESVYRARELGLL